MKESWTSIPRPVPCIRKLKNYIQRGHISLGRKLLILHKYLAKSFSNLQESVGSNKSSSKNKDLLEEA